MLMTLSLIMAESADELQHALREFQIYCSYWKLRVNVDKTKILVFSKGSLLKTKFYYNNLVIENVKEIKYLGAVFSRTGSFSKTKNTYVNKHKKLCIKSSEKLDNLNYQLIASLTFLIKL